MHETFLTSTLNSCKLGSTSTYYVNFMISEMAASVKTDLLASPSKKYIILSDTQHKVSIVPLIWLDDTRSNFSFPKVRDPNKLKNLVRECATPGNSWRMYPIEKIFNETGNSRFVFSKIHFVKMFFIALFIFR